MHIPSLKEVVSADEWQLRCDLAAAMKTVTVSQGANLVWPALQRKLERLDPGSKT